jgi:predicted transposase YbfD/YdcC
VVIRKGGEYVGALKGNQHDFHEDVKLYFDEGRLEELRKDERSYYRTVDKEQSGAATREYYLTGNIKWVAQRKEWAGIRGIGCVRRTLEELNGDTIVETRYFITRLKDVGVYAKSVRRHWG